MRNTMRVATAALVLCCGLALAQEKDAAAAKESPEQVFLRSLHFAEGEVSVPEAHARLHLGEGFRYLAKADARRVLEEFWGNPEDDSVLGMLVPVADGLDSEHSWAVVLTWIDDGHISDEDAAEIDYDELLADMQQDTRDANPQLQAAGYPAVELQGWAQPPRYDAIDKRLHWAKALQFEGHDSGTLNYDIRVLGREGVLSMNAVASLDDLDRVNRGMAEVLPMAEFEPGQRYADFNEDTDRLAEYGLATLVGGAIAAKSGLLAKLGILLLKAWKLVLVGAVAIGAGVKKLFAKKEPGGTVS